MRSERRCCDRGSLSPCWRALVPHVTWGMLTMQRVSNFVLELWSCLESGEKMEAHFIIFTRWAYFAGYALNCREVDTKKVAVWRNLFSIIELLLPLLSHGKLRVTFLGGEWWCDLFPRLVAEQTVPLWVCYEAKVLEKGTGFCHPGSLSLFGAYRTSSIFLFFPSALECVATPELPTQAWDVVEKAPAL